MSVWYQLFIGPYAEFQVPPGTDQRFPPEDETGEPLCSDELYCYDDIYGPPESCRYVPHGNGRHKLPRSMYFADSGGLIVEDQDLTDLDRDAEMQWLARTFAKEFKLLAKRFGAPPVFRWGIVFWVT